MNLHQDDTHLKRLCRFNFLLAYPCGLGSGPGEFCTFLEKLRFTSRTGTPELVRHLAHHCFHHRQVLEIVVGLEKGHTRIELDKDAAK